MRENGRVGVRENGRIGVRENGRVGVRENGRGRNWKSLTLTASTTITNNTLQQTH